MYPEKVNQKYLINTTDYCHTNKITMTLKKDLKKDKSFILLHKSKNDQYPLC